MKIPSGLTNSNACYVKRPRELHDVLHSIGAIVVIMSHSSAGRVLA
jgi:hypothetical protein